MQTQANESIRMFPSQRRSVPAAAVLLLLLTLLAARWLVGATEAMRRPGGSAYGDLLLAGAAWVLLGCAAWAVVIAVAALVETTSCGLLPATAWVGCPRPLRRLLLTGLGVALVGTGPVQPAATASDHAPLPVPARPVGLVQSDTGHAHDRPVVVVHRGDNLWRIADERLPSSARAGEVAALVDDLHRRNRGVIGPDPDLIRPGQRLAVPTDPNRLNHTSTEETR
jgi:hypothetical protein